GWSSYQGYNQLKRDVIRVKPRVVVIEYGWNDHWIGFGIEDKNVGKIKRMQSSIPEELRGYGLFQLITKAMVGYYVDNNSRPNRVSPDDFRENLVNMVRTARENDITPVLITAPTSHVQGSEPSYLAARWLRSLDELVPLHREYASIVREVSASEDVVLCDILEDFEKLPREDVEEKYFSNDGIHLKPEGNKKISELLVKCFEENGLLDELIKKDLTGQDET
ncbi:MAG: SGNH/GDSL hydrolase family protein, partial [Candidatus Altiarchaeota archaeon]